MTCWLCGFKTNSPGPGCKNGDCQICTKIAMVDEEIIQAAATLRHLLTKRCDLRSQHNRAHDTMRRLPLELTNRIFTLVLPPRDEWGKIVTTRRRLRGKPPSYLTSICKDWRDIAWSNPFLWSTVPIMLGTPSTSDSTWVSCVYDWIQRSGTLPLTLHITVSEDHILENDSENCHLEEQLSDVLAVMSRCSNEWQSLSLDVPGSLLRPLQSGGNHDDLESHLRTVRRLRIIGEADDWDDDNVPSTMNPETIEISCLSFRLIPMSWTNLTSAGISYWDMEDILLLFQHALLMTCCSIWMPYCLSDTTPMMITHHMLQTLTLQRDDEDVASVLLDSLTLPCLRTTEIDADDIAHLLSLMHRSSCPLSRVKLRGLPEEEDLQPFSGVTDLVLEGVGDDAKMKELLLGGYFPDLRHLTLPLESFWESDTISTLLKHNRPQPDALSEMTLRTIFVPGPWPPNSDSKWDSEFGRQLKGFKWTVRFGEGGFELLIPDAK